MSATGGGYLHARTPFDLELARLRLLETRYDEVTRSRLSLAGSLAGARCLEVGAGAGSVARLLATAVGPKGQVVAVDCDPRFLGDLNLTNVTVRQHDIVTQDIGVGGFDLVHCRALLLHLADPEVALVRMAAALEPGGWLLVEDADFSSFTALAGHAASAVFDDVSRAWIAGCHDADRVDVHFGRRLPRLFDELGLVERGSEALAFRRVGGSSEAELFALVFEAVRDGLLPGWGIAEGRLDAVISALRDPTFAFQDSLNVAAWGRRPTSGMPDGTSAE